MEKIIHSSDPHNTPASDLAGAKTARNAMNMLEGENQLAFLVRVLGPKLSSDVMKQTMENGMLACNFPLSVGAECSFSFSVDLPIYLDMNRESFLARIVTVMKGFYPELKNLDIIPSLEVSKVFSKKVVVTFTMNKKS